MKIEEIELPPDWKTFIGMLAQGANLRILYPHLQHRLQEAGYIEKCSWGRSTVVGTSKLKKWWEEHRHEANPTYPYFEEWWASCPSSYKIAPLSQVIAKEAWLAALRAGKEIL